MSNNPNPYHPFSVDAFCLAHVRGETKHMNYRAWLREQRERQPELVLAEQQADEQLLEAA